jgi:hypothetical protein
MDDKQHTNKLNVAASKQGNALIEMVQMDWEQKYMLLVGNPVRSCEFLKQLLSICFLECIDNKKLE